MESVPTPERPHRIAGDLSPQEIVALGDGEAIVPLQKVLALIYFQEKNEELSIDVLHPDLVDRTTRNDAMMLWLEGGDDSLSARFRAYADSHAHETLSISDTAKILEILHAIDPSLDVTVH